MFFRLNAFAFLVIGETNYSIYDMKSNLIYILNQKAGIFMEKLEKNVSLESIKEYEENKDRCLEFLELLVKKRLGNFFNSEVHIEKFQFSATFQKKGMLEPVPQYVKCYLEISNICDLKCSFCGNPQYVNWLSCQSCFRNQIHQSADIRYDKLIGELEDLCVRELVLGGKDPLSKIEVLYEIVNECKKNNRIGLTIVTPGNVDTDELLKISRLYKKIKWNIVIFGTCRFFGFMKKEMQDLAQRQENLFNMLREQNIPYSITFQIYEANRKYAESIINDVKNKFGVTPMVADIVNMEKREKLTHIRMNQKVLSQYKNPREFYLRKTYNPCLYGVFSIDLFGNVSPCPGIPRTLGNIADSTLHEILSKDSLYSYWTHSKDKVSYCKNCAMRYFCSDCSIFELAPYQNGDVHNMLCPANVDKTKVDISNVKFINWDKEYLNIDC